MSKVIALTGGIGSGKTFVASIFQKLGGIPCFCSDLEAKKIMNENDYIKKEIISFLGPKSFVNNKLNSQFIRNKIFNSQNKLKSKKLKVKDEAPRTEDQGPKTKNQRPRTRGSRTKDQRQGSGTRHE